MLLPQKLGPITLMRKLGTDGVTEAFVGILDEPAGQQVVVRKLLPFVAKDAARLSAVEARVQDLTAVRHPTLVPVQRLLQIGEERMVIQDEVDAVSVGDVIAWCRKQGTPLPHNVFLNLATQICNGLEALHGRPGKESGEEHVLHLALGPNAVLVTREGRLVVGEYGLVRSPTTLPSSGGTEAAASRLAHISPEQTHPDQKLTPASDIFCLGSLLYEMLMLEPLFRRDSSLQTIHAVRKAEVSGALQHVKKALPGLDKVLYRALSLNPRHRYQRAFVLREDVRGLMAGYSFTKIGKETADFLEPLFAAHAASKATADTGAEPQDNTLAVLRQATGLAEEPRPARSGRPPADTLVPTFPTGPAAAEEDELAGLEMWSEVPTTVDPTDASAVPIPSDPGVPLDQTSWIRREHKPAPDVPPVAAFEADVATDVRGMPEKPSTDITGEKRQMSPDELAALGVKVRPTPEPAPYRAEGTGSGASDTMAMFVSEPEAPTAAPDDAESAPPRPADSGMTQALGVAAGAAAVGSAAAAGAASAGASDTAAPAPPPAPEPQPAPVPAPAPRKAQPNPKSSYRPPGAATPKAPPPRANVQARKLEGLTFDEDEVTSVAEEDDEDLEWRPRRGRGLAIAGGALAIFVVVLLCGGVGVFAGTAAWSSITNGLGGSGGPVASNGPGLSPRVPPTDPTPLPGTDPTPTETATPPKPIEPSDGGGNDAVADAADPVVAAADPEPMRSTPPEPTPIRSTPPDPTPIRSRPDPTPVRSPPEPTRASLTPTSSSSTPATSRTVSRDPDPPRLSAFDDGAMVEPTNDVIESEVSDLDALASKARSGRLSAADRLTLEMTESSDASYTRANSLLYQDAKARSDGQAQRKYMDALLSYPGNNYDPRYLAEASHLDIQDKRWDRALARATKAERHWGRLPTELVFSRKSMIYEAQAAAWQGKFYQSGGSDLAALGNAIAAWEKYQRHAATRSRSDLSRIADSQLAKLYDARRRLE